MSIPSCGLGRDDRPGLVRDDRRGLVRDDRVVPTLSTSALAEALALLAELGWVQALFKVREAQLILATSRATIYRDIAAGRLDAVKIGSATRITAQSLARRLAGLPTHPSNISDASFGTGTGPSDNIGQPTTALEPKDAHSTQENICKSSGRAARREVTRAR